MTLRIYCSFCSADVRDDSNICPSCGLALEDVARRRLEEDQHRHRISGVSPALSAQREQDHPQVPADSTDQA